MSQNQSQIHATAIALDGAAALIIGPPGSGKSDLALRCISQGAWIDGRHCLAMLVADDQVIIEQHGGGGLVAHPPDAIVGRIEVRGLGIMNVPNVQGAEVALAVELVSPPQIERLPEAGSTWPLLGAEVPLLRISPFEASAHLKVLLALARGLPNE